MEPYYKKHSTVGVKAMVLLIVSLTALLIACAWVGMLYLVLGAVNMSFNVQFWGTWSRTALAVGTTIIFVVLFIKSLVTASQETRDL